MALARALARSFGQWGRCAAQETAGPWTGCLVTRMSGAKAHALCTHTAATAYAAQLSAAEAAAALQHACAPRLPIAATAARAMQRGSSSIAATAGPAGLRPLSSSARDTLQDAAHRVRKAASSSADAFKTVGEAMSKAPAAMYNVLPTSAKQLVNATQTPGALNRVIGLQLTAFWQNHNKAIIAIGAVALCYGTWHALYHASQVFVDVSSTAATSGLLALSAAAVACGYLYLRRRYTIDSQAVYRMAMYRLNTHPGLLEVMGAPLVGSSVQASVLTGGGMSFKGLRPRLHSKRIQMIFPLKGSDRRGLASLEAKKRHGQLQFKLLAVDVPCVGGGEQRIFLEGGPTLYERGGVFSVLRDPFIRALSLDEVYAAEDEAEEQQEQQQRRAQAAARQAAAASKQPKPLDQGGGMYFYERLMVGAREALTRLGGKQRPGIKGPTAAGQEQAPKQEPAAATSTA